MLSSIQKNAARSLIVASVLTSTCLVGCAVKPLDFEETASTRRDFSGFTTQPSERIKIQAQNNDGEWFTLKTTTTGESAISGFSDVRYYYWNTRANVPAGCWKDYGYFEDAYYQGAKVRVVDESGKILYTYRKEVSATELLTKNPIDLWNEKGNPKDHIQIWLKTARPYRF